MLIEGLNQHYPPVMLDGGLRQAVVDPTSGAARPRFAPGSLLFHLRTG